MNGLRVSLVLVLLGAVGSQAAEVAASRWEPEAPPSGGGPVNPPDSPSGPEWDRFWERLQTKVFDDICKNIKLPLKQDFHPIDEIGINVGVERRLARFPDKRLAIVDTTKLGLSLGYGMPILQEAIGSIGVGVEARLEGRAMVIRPLDKTSDCAEIGSLLNLLDFKTVIPVSAKRLSEMEVRELWKLPLELRAGGSISPAMPLGPGSFSISLGYSQSENASITLLRLSTETLRLRIRIDRASIISAGGQISATIPVAGPLGLDAAENIVEKAGDKLVLREINRYLSNALGASYWNREGRKAMLEFILDPNDTEQMTALASFIKGNLSAFSVLLKVLGAAADTNVRRGEIGKDLTELQEKYEEKLNAERSFAGASDYERIGKRLYLQIPFLTRHEGGTENQNDAIISGAFDHSLNIHQKSDSGSHAWFDIPLMGQIFKKDSQEIVQGITRVDSKGFSDAPFIAYIQQEGNVRHREKSARAQVESANSIMRLAGTRGEGENTEDLLPTDVLFPPREDDDNPMYRSALSAFSLVFNQNALQDILWAPAAVVFKAYGNAMSAEKRAQLEMALAHGSLSETGEFSLDRGRLRTELWRKGFDTHSQQGRELIDDIARLARRAAGMVQDLIAARKEDWKGRVAALTDIIAGEGKSGLEYEEVMRVFVQLTDPANLFGEFRIQTNKKIKGEKDVTGRYLLNRASQDPAYREALLMKERFAEPGLLND